MARITAVQINIDQIAGLANRVSALDAETFAQVAVTALNDAADSAYELSRDRITAGINISDDYIRQRMSVDHATRSRLRSEIVATGAPSRMTRLVHYGAQMVIVPRKTATPSRARGSTLRIGSGQKQAGVRVHVKTPKTISRAFMLPLKRGNEQGEKLGVFIREKNKLKHLYGPSVYQLFRYQAGLIEDEVGADLQDRFLTQVDAEIRKVLA